MVKIKVHRAGCVVVSAHGSQQLKTMGNNFLLGPKSPKMLQKNDTAMIDKRLSRQTATMPFMTVPRHGAKDIYLLVANSIAD